MNKDIKAKWIAALRSGEYRQGKHFLRSGGDEYCCLGVLDDIISPEQWRITGAGWVNSCSPHETSADRLDSKIQDILAIMNDKGSSFSEIADYIEKEL